MSSLEISPASLQTLRASLTKAGLSPSGILRAAGAESGDHLYEQWRAYLGRLDGPDDPGLVDQRHFGAILTSLLERGGWGRCVVDQIGADGVVLVVEESAESEPGTSEGSTCHFLAGALAAFLTELAETPLSVVEVECRSVDSPACHFLVGSPEFIAAAEDLLVAERDWRELFGAVRPY